MINLYVEDKEEREGESNRERRVKRDTRFLAWQVDDGSSFTKLKDWEVGKGLEVKMKSLFLETVNLSDLRDIPAGCYIETKISGERSELDR